MAPRRNFIFKALFFSCLFMLAFGFAKAQDNNRVYTTGFRFLDYGNDLPSDLLSTKTAVFIDMPVKDGTSLRGDWKGMAKTAHKTFKQAGIDAVYYYHMNDLEANGEVAEAFAQKMKNRKVENIIVLKLAELEIAGKATERYVLLATDFNNQYSFISDGQEAYKEVDKDLEDVLDNFYKDCRNADQPSTNNLIADNPVFDLDIDIIEGERFESFSPDINVDKLAVPLYQKVEIPDDHPGGRINRNLEDDLEKYNNKVDKYNRDIKNIMKDYPYDFEYVKFNGDEKELRDNGFQYVLYNINTTARNIRKILNYEEVDKDSYMTLMGGGGSLNMRKIPADAPVYKFYMKQLYTGDIYLGNQWDADESWQDALIHHLDNLNKEQ